MEKFIRLNIESILFRNGVVQSDNDKIFDLIDINTENVLFEYDKWCETLNINDSKLSSKQLVNKFLNKNTKHELRNKLIRSSASLRISQPHTFNGVGIWWYRNKQIQIDMKAKHTKGKWIIESTKDTNSLYSMIYSGEVRIAEVKSYGKDSKFNDATYEEKEANAKLIAAAPEMLEALIVLNNYIKEDSAIYRSSLQCKYIDELITKATK
jgi:hypothetical protein